MSRPLPRFRVDTDPRKLDRIIGHGDTPTVTTHSKATLPGDSRRLRGIPVVGGVSGTSPGTDPLAAVLAKERFKSRRVNRA